MAPTPVSLDEIPTSPETSSKFKEILKSNGITDPVAEVLTKDSGLRGENLSSETEYIVIKFVDPNKKPLNLFVKKMHQVEMPPEMQKMVDDLDIFGKEGTFYLKYLSAAGEYCKSKGQEDLMKTFSKCFYGDKKMLVFENLVLERGYTLLSKATLQDFEAARIALINLAKHHAIAHALIKESGGPEAFFNRFPKLDFEAFHTPPSRMFLAPTFENAIKTNIAILEKSGVDGIEEAIGTLKSIQGNAFDFVTGLLKTSKEDFLVLDHGDYWNNNMMFLKDKETGKIIDHIPIDFQNGRYNSPSLDLGYFLYTSVQPDIRRAHLWELLKIYLDTLNKTSKDLGHPINLKFEDLEADFCKRFKFGFWFAALMLNNVGMAILKDIDMKETFQDINGVGDRFNSLVVNWIDSHPGMALEFAKNLVEAMKEYENLQKKGQAL